MGRGTAQHERKRHFKLQQAPERPTSTYSESGVKRLLDGSSGLGGAARSQKKRRRQVCRGALRPARVVRPFAHFSCYKFC